MATISNNIVLVIDEDGTKLGNMPYESALSIATSKGLNLVSINTQSRPPVYKVMDEGKWKYEQKKKSKQKHQHQPGPKDIKFGVRIDPHDLQFKIKHAIELSEKGHPITITVEMRGREKAHSDIAVGRLNEVLLSMGDHIVYDLSKLKKSSQMVSISVSPSKKAHHG